MRLDHLLSREQAEVETRRLIPRSIPARAIEPVQYELPSSSVPKRHNAVSAFRSVSFSGFGELSEPCTLTTAYEKDEINLD